MKYQHKSEVCYYSLNKYYLLSALYVEYYIIFIKYLLSSACESCNWEMTQQTCSSKKKKLQNYYFTTTTTTQKEDRKHSHIAFFKYIVV
jgi:predicted amidophosphoribosyltransferase